MPTDRHDQHSNSGILFKNGRKENDRQPDYTGSWHDAAGNEHWLSAWIKDGRKGKFMTLSAKPKGSEQQRGTGNSSSQPAAITSNHHDEVPF